jgi:hypothetical protein
MWSAPLIVRVHSRPRLRQPRAEDPHELRRRLRAELGPSIRQVVLDGRVRQAEPVGGFLLRPGSHDRGHDDDLAVRGASGVGEGRRVMRCGPARTAPAARRDA